MFVCPQILPELISTMPINRLLVNVAYKFKCIFNMSLKSNVCYKVLLNLMGVPAICKFLSIPKQRWVPNFEIQKNTFKTSLAEMKPQ